MRWKLFCVSPGTSCSCSISLLEKMRHFCIKQDLKGQTSESDDYYTVNLKTFAFVLSPVDSVGKVVDVSVGSHDLHIDIYS